MSSTRTAEQVIETVRQLANENPDFVYKRPLVEFSDGVTRESSRCQYVHAEGPGCIMGHALARLGLTVPLSCEGKGIVEVLRFFGIEGAPDEGFWLGEVQRSQDVGHRWADAVVDADVAAEQRERQRAHNAALKTKLMPL